jgi:hypothetical protein
VGGGRSWQSLKNRWKVHLHDAASELVAHGRTAPRAYPDGHEYYFVVRDGAVVAVLVGDENTPPDDHCGGKHKEKGAEAQDAAVADVRVADEQSPPDDPSGDGDGDMDMDMACTQYPADVVNQLAHVAKEISRAAGCSIGAAHAALHATSMGMCDPIPACMCPMFMVYPKAPWLVYEHADAKRAVRYLRNPGPQRM